jgi:phosphoribosylformylglycinamidine synthase PurS subunit
MLQTNLDQVDARTDIEAVALAYGLCGRGVAGLRPLRHRLVIPRAHDCITVFLGSKEAYAEHRRRCPTAYYYSPGWNRGRRVPGPERLESLRAEFAAKFDSEDVEFLLESERGLWAQHDTATYVDLGTDDSVAEAQYARKCADWLGWKFEHLRGDPTLLRDLLWGRWDEKRFQIIEPGMQLGHAPDESIMRSEPAGDKPASVREGVIKSVRSQKRLARQAGSSNIGPFRAGARLEMKAKIIVTPKKAVLDPQGKTVQNALEQMGYHGIGAVHVGKYLEIELPGSDKESWRKQIDEACHRILSNPVIEDYRFDIE